VEDVQRGLLVLAVRDPARPSREPFYNPLAIREIIGGVRPNWRGVTQRR